MQESLSCDVKKKSKGEGSEPGAPEHLLPLQPLRTLKPFSAKCTQCVLVKENCESMVRFAIGLVLATFPGSVQRCKGDSRRVTAAKALSVASPVNVISKVKVLKGKILGEDGLMAINCLNEQCIVDIWDLCGEIDHVPEGTKGGNMFVTFKPEVISMLLTH